MTDWTHISEQISQTTSRPFSNPRADSIGGGCINRAYRLESQDQKYFVKLNRASGLDMFAAEAEGLQAMNDTGSVKVPRPICWGVSGNQAYLVMEYLELGGRNPEAIEQFGEQLAAMHRDTRAQFGWHRNNTIGSTEQVNTRENDWVTFWREHRLGFQLELAARRGYRGRLQEQGERLMRELDGFFTDYTPRPSLLHGDLWGGNYSVTREGSPAIFDPATYYGDREADLAMTELFGGFSPGFYRAYDAAWPLDSGYATRKNLYNLYHILNHLNLFGSGYLKQAEHLCVNLLSELGIGTR